MVLRAMAEPRRGRGSPAPPGPALQGACGGLGAGGRAVQGGSDPAPLPCRPCRQEEVRQLQQPGHLAAPEGCPPGAHLPPGSPAQRLGAQRRGPGAAAGRSGRSPTRELPTAAPTPALAACPAPAPAWELAGRLAREAPRAAAERAELPSSLRRTSKGLLSSFCSVFLCPSSPQGARSLFCTVCEEFLAPPLTAARCLLPSPHPAVAQCCCPWPRRRRPGELGGLRVVPAELLHLCNP